MGDQYSHSPLLVDTILFSLVDTIYEYNITAGTGSSPFESRRVDTMYITAGT
jgi:hypothetical protein